MRSERKRVLNDEGETGRLLTFCDGVFAIAITLLVLAIHVPLPTELGRKSLLDLLGEQWPIYGYNLGEPLPDQSSLTRIRERYGVEVFLRFFDALVEQCQLKSWITTPCAILPFTSLL